MSTTESGPVRADMHRRVVVISASVGAGHDGTTRELAARLRDRGFEVDCLDVTDVFPWRLGRLLRGTYHGLLLRLPWIYDGLFAIACRFRGAGPITRALLRPVRSRMLRALPADAGAVVSTYPIASQLLGPLRRDGRLAVPVITYLTDFAVHPIWLSPGVDVHFAAHETSLVQALAYGASDVRVAGRLVSPRCRPASAAEQQRARQRFGLPPDGRLALLVAGAWGVGEVAVTAAEIAATGAAIPVTVCGRNTALRRRMTRAGIGHVLGWVDDMPELLRAADVLVENGGGLTALEAMACGLPVLTYRPLPGHGKASAATMAEAGVTTLVRGPDELRRALTEVVVGEGGRRAREAVAALFAADPATGIADIAAAERPTRAGLR
ncbi:glycosyltransferase [Dactylosporangium sp. AC04546]|uniref:glycosyltransferase n=1 Tax=Dactylosporangium sp. AC04546 TaxID=2862460 RepID=UPI001EDE2A0B|nr:glycosyltransferase [Dactylosporangium sp. AC04546]WVK88819.1 glycosyltransferase [Dactylosporangium sp. AC04546]